MMSDTKTGGTNGDIRLPHLIRTDKAQCVSQGDLCLFVGLDDDEQATAGLIVMVVAVATAREVYDSPDKEPYVSHALPSLEELERGFMMAQCLLAGELVWIPFEALTRISSDPGAEATLLAAPEWRWRPH